MIQRLALAIAFSALSACAAEPQAIPQPQLVNNGKIDEAAAKKAFEKAKAEPALIKKKPLLVEALRAGSTEAASMFVELYMDDECGALTQADIDLISEWEDNKKPIGKKTLRQCYAFILSNWAARCLPKGDAQQEALLKARKVYLADSIENHIILHELAWLFSSFEPTDSKKAEEFQKKLFDPQTLSGLQSGFDKGLYYYYLGDALDPARYPEKQNQWTASSDGFLQGYKLFQQAGDKGWQARSLLRFCQLRLDNGIIAGNMPKEVVGEAIGTLKNLAIELKKPEMEVHANLLLGRYLNYRGNFKDGLAACQEATRIAKEGKDKGLVAATLLWQGITIKKAKFGKGSSAPGFEAPIQEAINIWHALGDEVSAQNAATWLRDPP